MLPVPYFCYLFHIYVTRVCIPRLEAFMKAWNFPTDSKFVLSLVRKVYRKVYMYTTKLVSQTPSW